MVSKSREIMFIFDVVTVITILLTFIQSAHSKQELQCSELVEFGNNITKLINYHFSDKNMFKCINNRCDGLLCSGVADGPGAKLLGNITVSMNIDYCSQVINLKVNASNRQVINVTLHDKMKRVNFTINQKVPTNVFIASDIALNNGTQKLEISIKATVVFTGGSMGPETKTLPITGLISNMCSKPESSKSTQKGITTTKKPVASTVSGKGDKSTSASTTHVTIHSSTQSIIKSTTNKPTTNKPTTSKPTTSKPTTSKPTTSKPTTSKPTTSKPTTSKPTTSKPTTNRSTTKNPTKKSPTKISTSIPPASSTAKTPTSKGTTTTKRTSASPTVKSTSLQPTTTAPVTTIATKPKTKRSTEKTVTPTTVRPSPKSGHKKYHSRTTKAVLLVLAIVILLVVVGLVIYCRKKKRLSNLPAYYNDIVINDPLKMDADSDVDNVNEVDDNNVDDDDDDDEIPLFA